MYYTCSLYVRKKECDNNHSIRKDVLEEKVSEEINNRRSIKIDKKCLM